MDDDTNRRPIVYDRMFNPPEGCVLHHYCSTESFLAIVGSGRLRFSDVNMMNDAEEGRYGYALFEEAATSLIQEVADKPALDGLNVDFFDRVDRYLSPSQLASHPVVACFSKAPDVLSQWRAYASDGQGWSIGFSAAALRKMPVTLLEVLYDHDQQLREVRNQLGAMFLLGRQDPNYLESRFGQDCALLSSFLLAMKNPGFREEQEVRALHLLDVELGDDRMLLTDAGGSVDGETTAGEAVGFRAAGQSVIVHVDLPFGRPGLRSIEEVWFGPRNRNGPGNAWLPLSHARHFGVRLEHARTAYRG